MTRIAKRAAVLLATLGLGGWLLLGCDTGIRADLRPADFQRPPAAPAPADPQAAGRDAPSPAAPPIAHAPPNPAPHDNPAAPPDSSTHAQPRQGDARPAPAADPGRDPHDPPAAITPRNPAAGSPDNRRAAEEPLLLDAMVGQVNGKPIYASEIFRDIGIEQIQRLGRTQPPELFRHEMMELIALNLQARIQDALILREAERELSERERQGLRQLMQRERERLLARFGGVLAHAEQGVLRETGRTLDQQLEAHREAVLVERYKHEKLFPRINVTRRDVERYYHDNHDRFNQAPTATVRIIVVRDSDRADSVADALAQAVPFHEVAERYSEVRAASGGLVPTFEIGDNALAWPQLNEALNELRPGQHSDRIEIAPGYAWVMLEQLEGGSSKTLEQAYLEIEQRLNVQRFNRLSRQYIADLMAAGSYTPINQMANALLDVAIARFARPHTDSDRPTPDDAPAPTEHQAR